MTEHLEGDEIGPLDVVDHQDRRSSRRDVADDRHDLLEKAELRAGVGQHGRDKDTVTGLGQTAQLIGQPLPR